MKRKQVAGHYYSLEAIGERMGVSSYSIRRYIAKYRFPAYRKPTQAAAGGFFYVWYTNDQLINSWEQQHIEDSWKYFTATVTGKRLAYTREPHHQPDRTDQSIPAPLLIDNDLT